MPQTASAPALSEQPGLAREDTLLARAAGYDVAAAATDTGLVISAQATDPERSYPPAAIRDTQIAIITTTEELIDIAHVTIAQPGL